MTSCSRAARMILMLILSVFCVTQAMAGERPLVTVLPSQSNGVYRDLAETFAMDLGKDYSVRIESIDNLSPDQLRRLDQAGTLIVPVGIKAARTIYGQQPRNATILSLMVSEAGYESLLKTRPASRHSAVFIDQPLSRSLALIHLLRPDARYVGLLYSNETAGLMEGYRQKSYGQLDLVTEKIGDSSDVPEALQRILPKVDVFLLTADSNVVNSNTIRYILLTCYRQQTPVVGFSRGIVNAGAVAAVVSDPASIAQQGARLAKSWNPATGSIQPATYASQFALVFNYPVARSLGVSYPVDSQEIDAWRRSLGQ